LGCHVTSYVTSVRKTGKGVHAEFSGMYNKLNDIRDIGSTDSDPFRTVAGAFSAVEFGRVSMTKIDIFNMR
jgi:enamine deaminase RidA (YjgF/YER057c/UK114 family)